MEYKVDTSYDYYRNNWFIELDFICAPQAKVDLIATVWMIGIGLGAFCMAWLPDYFGRRKTLLITGLFTLPAQIFCIHVQNYWVRLSCMGVISFLYIQKSLCFNYIYELIEKRHHPKL